MVLQNILGHSIESEQFQLFKKKHFQGDITKLETTFLYPEFRNETKGIFINTKSLRIYNREFGIPKSENLTAEEVFIIEQVTVDNNYSSKKIPSRIPLPFNILFGDNKEEILKKIEKKPNERTSTQYGFSWWFQFDDFRLLTALNPSYELIWIRIIKLTIDEKKKIKLKKELTQQNKNIKIVFSKKILSFKLKTPTIEWRIRKNSGDNNFTDKGIDEIEVLLKNYVDILIKAIEKKNASVIYNSIKKVVKNISKINDENNFMIETIEREELCDFINNIVRQTGLNIDEKVDLTEEWREW
nr:hypothetical protein [uncultured Psychroserpens sp.]